MSRVSSKTKKKVHFVGIGGIGISALARWFCAESKTRDPSQKAAFLGVFGVNLAQNWAVSGSDIEASGITRDLKKEGIKVKIGHSRASISPEVGLVIYNQAIISSNPELRETQKKGIKAFSYPQALGKLTRRYRTIAIAGTHGKSTTTSLLSLVLTKGGLDPTVVVGTKLRELRGKNFRFGRGRYLLIEADEWKASFLNYSPTLAVITNIDREHLDYYKNFSNIKKTFLKFIGNIQPGGILVVNRDDKSTYALKSTIGRIAKKNHLKVLWYSTTLNNKVKKNLKVPGRHNVSNATAAYTLARALGVREKTILHALGQYRGAWRRMEYRGKLNFKGQISKVKCPIYDDYAHHPTEIKAALQGFREKFPRRKIICVFQPHQAHRLKNLFKEFTTAFEEADYLILLPIYQVAGRDRVHKGYTSKDLAEAIAIPNSVTYLPHPKRLRKILEKSIRVDSDHSDAFVVSDRVIVMMGAGDIVNYTDQLLKTKKRSR